MSEAKDERDRTIERLEGEVASLKSANATIIEANHDVTRTANQAVQKWRDALSTVTRERDAARKESVDLQAVLILLGTLLHRYQGNPFRIWFCGDHYHIEGNGISVEHNFIRGCIEQATKADSHP